MKENENDSFVLLKMLSSHLSGMTYTEHILSTMAKVQGPWSFVYWQVRENFCSKLFKDIFVENAQDKIS